MIVPGLVRGEEVGQRSETVRRANLSAIVRELHAHGPLTRSELVSRTGLTRSAIRGLIGELTGAGFVSEERSTGQGTPGRPSPVVRLNPRRAVALALEIDVDTLAAAAVGLGGEVLARTRVDRPSSHVTVESVSADLAELAGGLRNDALTPEALVGVGVGVVGVTRRSDGLVSMAPNLGWRDVPLGAVLARALDMPVPVSVANEADLGALAEHRRGAAVGFDHVLFIDGEVGVGGGLIVDGKPLAGAAGYGGEVGHIPVNPAGMACRCGSVGCWETEVGALALLRRAGHPPGGGRKDVDAVLRDAEAGVPAAIDALAEVGRWLGIGLAGLVNVLNPEVIVLGGLFGRIQPYAGRALDGALDRMALSAPRGLVRIVPAKLGVDAPLIGAAEYAFEPLLADPAAWLTPRRELVALASA
ncbi:MAG TPA: ROK family transcriptional regulator [Candidatus Limnocylindrales bacterium]|nr:ROK family transcriptional regulator [Candidatus Limnocylindrales bacterium]